LWFILVVVEFFLFFCLFVIFFFFFQAEDGIRDRNVTGVQTCALPICRARSSSARLRYGTRRRLVCTWTSGMRARRTRMRSTGERSEERRVGKECRCRWVR